MDSRVLYGHLLIQKKIVSIANYFNFSNHEELVFVPILQGVVPFFSDIVKNIEFDPFIEYIGVSSYKGESQKEFNLYKSINPEIVKGRKVWVFDDIADSIGINKFHIFTTYINKKEFAEKFLKGLKKYMKSSGEGESVHSIRFDLTTKYEMEIKIILKKDVNSWRVGWEVKNLAKDYLDSLGYKNVRVYIP